MEEKMSMYLYQILQGKEEPSMFKIFVYWDGFPVILNLEKEIKSIKQQTKKKIFLV